MPPKPIELMKARDFGEVISDTFTFVRQNFKPLARAFFVFCGFFILASTVATCLQQMKVADIATGRFSNSNTFDSETGSYGLFKTFGIEAAVSILFVGLTYNAISLVVFCYMAIYQQKGNVPPTNEEIWGYFKYYYFRTLGANLLVFLLMCVGFVLCLIPGIYLIPIMSLIMPIIVIENAGFGFAFNRSFQLIKEHWWITFGTIFVISLIASLSMKILALPLELVNLFQILLHGTMKFNKGILAATVILQNICLIFMIVPNVAIALCYYNLTEVKEGTGLLGRIEQKFGQAPQTGTKDLGEEY